jgi:hypothetical protein
LSLLRPEPTLHVGSGHVSRIAGAFGAEAATLDQGRRASLGASSAPPLAPDATPWASALRPCLPWALVTGAPPLAPSVPKVGATTMGLPCTAKLIRHKRHQCFVSAHAAKGLLARPEPYAMPKVPSVGGQGRCFRRPTSPTAGSTRRAPNASPKTEYSAWLSRFCSTLPISPHPSIH